MMTLHLGVLNEEFDMRSRTWDNVRGISAKIRCPRDLGVGICAWLCVYDGEFEIGGKRVGPQLRHGSVLGRGCLGGAGATSGH